MNISTHLMIDAIIVSAALTITLVLRAKGNAARKEKESEWLLKKKHKNSKNLNYLKFGISLFMEELSSELGVTDPVSGIIVSKVGYHDR